MIIRNYKAFAKGKKTQVRHVQGDDYIDYDFGHRNGRVAAINHTVITNEGRVKFRVGRSYLVQPGGRRPAIHMVEDQYDHLVPVEVDKCIDSTTGNTIWHEAKTTNFISTGKPNAKCYLLNDGFYPLRAKVTAIREERLQDITADEAIAEGLDFIEPSKGGFPDEHMCPWAKWLVGAAYRDCQTGNFHAQLSNVGDGVFCSCYEGQAHQRHPAICAFISWWDSTHKKGDRWIDNPHIIVYKIEKEIERP